MIVSSCPLRISLFGGSTDSTQFIDRYGRGSVISFPCDLKTYVSLSKDKFGANNFTHKYILNYSRREEILNIEEIENEIIKIVLNYFKVEPISIFLTGDTYSQGSGLASSSSYLISLIKAVSMFKKISLTDHEICRIAFDLEKSINPYCGYQDPYGCGIGGFKKIDFYRDRINYEFLPCDIFDLYDMHLIFSGVTRNSKEVLKNVTENIDKAYPLLEIVDLAYQSLLYKDYRTFFELFNQSWEQKKKTSSMIVENESIQLMDKILKENTDIIAHKLCGAGNGGFYLTFSNKNSIQNSLINGNVCVKINVSTDGVDGVYV